MTFKSIIKNIKKFINIRDIDEKEIEKNLEIKKIVSFLIVFATTILTILNLLKQYYVMALTTSALTIAFLICISLCSDRNNITTINMIMSIAVVIIFSYYSISGQNDNFAILWVSLVPIISIIVVGIKNGIILSIYFQILLIVIFHTPLRDVIPAQYNETFMIRYPILFFVSLSISIYVTIRNERYKEDIKKALNYDKLTGLLNRDAYDEYIKTVELDNNNLFIIKITGVSNTNYKYGHDVSNRLIKYVADYIRTIFMDKYNIYRISGSMFAVITDDKQYNIEKTIKQIEQFSFSHNDEIIEEISLQVGVASTDDIENNNYNDLEKKAMDKLYKVAAK